MVNVNPIYANIRSVKDVECLGWTLYEISISSWLLRSCIYFQDLLDSLQRFLLKHVNNFVMLLNILQSNSWSFVFKDMTEKIFKEIIRYNRSCLHYLKLCGNLYNILWAIHVYMYEVKSFLELWEMAFKI